MEEKIVPIFGIGDQVVNLKVSTKPLAISKLGELIYYTEEGIIIPFDRQQEWRLYGCFKVNDEVLIPGKIVQSSGDTYHIAFPWSNDKGHICRCFEDNWIVPKEEGDRLFQKK